MPAVYKSSDIKVLTAAEGIRKRPGMYIGDTSDGSGLTNMLMEVVSNSLDQYLADKCTQIKVVIHPNNSIEVSDNGEGIPAHDLNGKSFIEHVFTELHSTATYDGHTPHVHAGRPRGIGVVVVNILSENCTVNSYHNGIHWRQQFDKGVPLAQENKGGTSEKGTHILFQPSTQYFSSIAFDQGSILTRLRELSYLNPGLNIDFEDKRTTKVSLCHPEGLTSYLEKIYPKAKSNTHRAFTVNGVSGDIKVEAAIQWAQFGGKQLSFANQLSTIDGGVHVKGVVAGISRVLKTELGGKKPVNTWFPIVSEGMYAVIHVNLANPLYHAPTKDRLITPEAYRATQQIMLKPTINHLLENTDLSVLFIERYVSRAIHKLWIKTYKKNSNIPTEIAINHLLESLFEQPERFLKLTDSFIKYGDLYNNNSPHKVSPDFLVSTIYPAPEQ